MKPIIIDKEEKSESLREKLNMFVEDVYKKFSYLNDDVYDFVNESPISQQAVSSAEAETDLGQTISNPPTQAEVQAISTKIDSLLAKLRSSNTLAT
jgi:hypothetical protein